MSDTNQRSARKKAWLRGILTGRADTGAAAQRTEEEADESVAEAGLEPEAAVRGEESGQPKYFFSLREQKDKITLDLVVAVENALNDRKLLQFKNKGLEEKLRTANESIERLKNEFRKSEQMVEDLKAEVSRLELKLTDKQADYDKLLNDYREYRNGMAREIEKLKAHIEKEQSKYAKLSEEYNRHQLQTIQKVRDLEERIRELEAENQAIANQHQPALAEKAELLQTISEFTHRMNDTVIPLAGKKDMPPASSE